MDIDKIIAEAHLKNSDWNLENYQEGSSVFHQIYCYVFDFDKQKLELISLNEERFYQVIQQSTYSADEMSHMLLKRLEQYFNGKRTQTVMSSLAMHMSAYIGGTQTWQQVRKKVYNGSEIKPHIFVTAYKSKRNIHKRLLRPFVIMNKQRALSSSDAVKCIGHVIQRDSQKHPEWLR
ncbi:hypothetical protein IOQ59_10980 [Pontibacterium sp. N1Y112]|uniref:Uncharacterized protein n=1 Tax=Pontibacterium sinense TaxID=2781979 RepID=A0A8J7FA54_9GAMM|nr:hypothetical protein [Pontibacterium sinense]MBE9397780.1 hypothetical protein [Pontibacterium sinense]